MLNKRCTKILFNLFEYDKVVKIEELANTFNVSNRTIRYDLDKIDYFLKVNNLSKIIRKPNSGILYKSSTSDKNKIYKIFNNLDFQEYILCQKERVVIILYELLNSKSNINYEILINKLKISKSTLVSDMKLVRQWLEKYNIKIINGKRNGIIFRGEEIEIRKATVDLLINYKNKYNIIETINHIYEKENNVIYNDLHCLNFNNEKIKFVQHIIKKLENKLNFVLSDPDFDKLTINTL
ncbi:HTH domain-containing protein, partial [Clostridium tarantellae]